MRVVRSLAVAWVSVVVGGCSFDLGPLDFSCFFGPDGFVQLAEWSRGEADALSFNVDDGECPFGCALDRPLRLGGSFRLEVYEISGATVRSTDESVLVVETTFSGTTSNGCEETFAELTAVGSGEAALRVVAGGHEVDRLQVRVEPAGALALVDVSDGEVVERLDLEAEGRLTWLGLRTSTEDGTPLRTGDPVAWWIDPPSSWWHDGRLPGPASLRQGPDATAPLALVSASRPGETRLHAEASGLEVVVPVSVVAPPDDED